MAAEWYCQVMGSELGPFSQSELVEMVRKHRLNPEDLVRKNGSPWIAAFEVKGLMQAASRPPKTEVAEGSTTSNADSAPSEPQSDRAKPRAGSEPRHDAPSADQQQVSNTTESSVESAAPPNPAEDCDWFCLASGQRRGPMTFDELKALAVEGNLRGNDRVWRTSRPKFKIASEVDGLEIEAG